MNVTIVCEGFNRDSLRLQPWRRVYEICTRLLANNDSITIISDQEEGRLNSGEIDGLRIIRMKRLMLAPILNKTFLVKTILTSNPDIVIWYGSPLSAIYLPRLKSIGKPLIWDIDSEVHSLWTLSKIPIRQIIHPHHRILWQQIVTAILPRIMIRSIANSAIIDKLIVPSNHLQMLLCRIGVKPAKISVIPSTIDKERTVTSNSDEGLKESKEIVGFNSGEFTIAYFGSPCTLRGVDTAVLSMPRILMKRKNVKLVIFSRRKMGDSNEGDASLRSEEESLSKLIKKLGLEEHIQIISGMLGKKTLEKYLYASDAIVLPFKIIFSEPPLIIFEAMTLGKVIVTTKIGALPEIVQAKRGMLIEPSDAQALAQTILFIADHPKESVHIGRNAQQYAANLPTWDQVALRFQAVLNETLRVSETKS